MSKPCYRPLADVDEIRLLCLQPGGWEEKLKYSIQHASLKDSPSYKTLSYVWGIWTAGLPIEVDGNDHLPRSSLRIALQHMRHKTESRVLWIDALCIDQQNTNERNHQFSQMGRIYSMASRVVSWLGDSDVSCSLAIKFLVDFRQNSQMEVSARDRDAVRIDNQTWDAILLLCRREYWSRLSIIQEVVLAKYISLQCGDSLFLWDDLEYYEQKLVHGLIIPKDHAMNVRGGGV
jgi:hypothetical protein